MMLASLPTLPRTNVQHLICCTTDGGPNEMACRKAISVLCRDIDSCWFFDNTCMEHAHHLVVLGGLKLCDRLLNQFGQRKWKFYSSVAMFTNVARANAKSLYISWCHLFGAESGLAKVKKLFPKCCSTRWGSIHVSEEMIMNATCDCLRKALLWVFGEKQGLVSAKQEHYNDNLTPDGLAIEAIQEFQLKMGKWRQITLEVLGDRIFEPVIEVMHRTRNPVIRVSNFLKSKFTDEELQNRGNHLSCLVNFKALEMFDTFNDPAGSSPVVVAAVFLRIAWFHSGPETPTCNLNIGATNVASDIMRHGYQAVAAPFVIGTWELGSRSIRCV